jgi:hypothetical protein
MRYCQGNFVSENSSSFEVGAKFGTGSRAHSQLLMEMSGIRQRLSFHGVSRDISAPSPHLKLTHTGRSSGEPSGMEYPKLHIGVAGSIADSVLIANVARNALADGNNIGELAGKKAFTTRHLSKTH